MTGITIEGQDGAVGVVKRMLDRDGRDTDDWRDAYVVTAFYVSAAPHWRIIQITPDCCAYAQPTEH